MGLECEDVGAVIEEGLVYMEEQDSVVPKEPSSPPPVGGEDDIELRPETETSSTCTPPPATQLSSSFPSSIVVHSLGVGACEGKEEDI